jgi:opacity protein-like surface antigen
MNKRIASPVIAIVMVACGIAAAHSADLDNVIYAPELPRTVPVEIGSGWYLRGDIGYNVSFSGSATVYRTYDPITFTYGDQPYDSAKFDADFTYGIGAGYQFTDWFRAEAMFTYMKGSFSGSGISSGPCLTLPGGPVDTGCSTDGSGDFTASGGMLNAYFDLGTYLGLTPYVGAGAGMTYLKYNDYVSQDRCVDGFASCGGATFGPLVHDGIGSWRFTYALMAGVSYDVTKNLKADIGYRYTNIAGGDMYDFSSESISAGAAGVQSSDDGFSSHEIKVSLRYSLW